MSNTNYPKNAFTLIELSIVLVIIGLLVGGVLVGRDLIQAAKLRAQISQLNEYTTAMRTFKLKYNLLPGDLSDNSASMFGFVPRTDDSNFCGNNDGYISSFWVTDTNSILNLIDYTAFRNCETVGLPTDESIMYWRDLAYAEMIAISDFNTAIPDFEIASSDRFFPKAKLDNTYIYIGNGAMNERADPLGYTLFGRPNITNLFAEVAQSVATLRAVDVMSLDNKMDDGDPLNGIVYTLNNVPRYGMDADKGVTAGCATDNGDGTGSYDLSTDDFACVVKVLVK